MAAVIDFLVATWTAMRTLVAEYLPVVGGVCAGIAGWAFGTWSARRHFNTPRAECPLTERPRP